MARFSWKRGCAWLLCAVLTVSAAGCGSNGGGEQISIPDDSIFASGTPESSSETAGSEAPDGSSRTDDPESGGSSGSSAVSRVENKDAYIAQLEKERDRLKKEVDQNAEKIAGLEKELEQMKTQMASAQSSGEPDGASSGAALPGKEGSEPLPEDVGESALCQIKEEQVREVYSYNENDRTYNRITEASDKSQLLRLVNSMSDFISVDPVSRPDAEAGFFILLKDDTKYLYYVTPDTVYPGVNEYVGDSAGIESTQEERDALLRLAKSSNQKYPGIPQWLCYMSASKITEIRFNGRDRSLQNKLDLKVSDSAAVRRLTAALKNITIDKGRTEVLSESTKMNPSTAVGVIQIGISFSTGVEYDIFIDDKTLGISSSDMTKQITYKLPNDDRIGALRDAASEIAG